MSTAIEKMLITVPEDEFKPLLDRERVLADIDKHFKPWIRVMADITNYGTALIPRCFASSERELKDAVVLPVLLRQVVAMLDSIEILLSNGATHAANLQMRALIEASIFIEWTLMADAATKANYYYVHNLRRKRLWAERMQTGSTESARFLALMEKSGVRRNEDVAEKAKEQLIEIDRVLSQPRFSKINDDFEKSRKSRRYDPAWYVPLGHVSFASVAKAVGKEYVYLLFYSGASEVMHSSKYDHHIHIDDGTITFQPIRSFDGFENLLQVSLSMAISAYMTVLKEYRPGEIAAFSRKYVEKWQREFMNIPKIKYAPETTTI